MLIKTVMQRWFDEHITYLPTKTPRVVRIAMNNMVRAFPRTHSRDLTDVHVRKYLRRRAKEGAGEATCRREFSLLLAACNHGIRNRWLSFEDRPMIRLPSPSPEREIYITRDVARILIDQAFKVSERCGLFVVIGMFTGARPTRVEQLRWEAVDLDREIIDFRPLHTNPKSKKRYTRVRIMKELKPYLLRAAESQSTRWVLGEPTSIRPQLRRAVNLTNEYLRMNGRADDVLDVHKITPNAMRHIWATWSAEDGVDLWMIARVLGNSLTTTERKYAHYHPSYQKTATDREFFTGDAALDVDEHFDLC